MRTEVDEDRWTVGRNDLERKRMAWLRKVLPRFPDPTRKFFGIHASRDAGDETRGLQSSSSVHDCIEGIDARNNEQFHGLSFLFRQRDDAREQFLFVIRK